MPAADPSVSLLADDFDPTQLLTLKEAAQVVRRSTRTLRRWCAAGDLPGAVRVKDQLYIPRADLRAMFRPAAPLAA